MVLFFYARWTGKLIEAFVEACEEVFKFSSFLIFLLIDLTLWL